MIASTSLICDKNLFPNPSPFDAPLTSPAISKNVSEVGIVFLDFAISVKVLTLSSGTITVPSFGSIVQKG